MAIDRRTARGRRYSTDYPIGKLMAKKGMKLADICAEADIAQRTIQYYIHGKPIHPSHLPKLCSALKCEVEDLLIQQKPPTAPS